MRKRVAVITIVSILLSPALGGLVGRVLSGFLMYNNTYFEYGMSYIGALAWIVASVIYYIDNRGR